MNVAEHPILDLEVLDQYCQLIGATILLKSVALFETQASDYLDKMNAAYLQGDQSILVSEAHKLKGAAGSIGLKRIQLLAESLQRNDKDNWQAEHGHWLHLVKNHLADDTERLKSHLLQVS